MDHVNADFEYRFASRAALGYMVLYIAEYFRIYPIRRTNAFYDSHTTNHTISVSGYRRIRRRFGDHMTCQEFGIAPTFLFALKIQSARMLSLICHTSDRYVYAGNNMGSSHGKYSAGTTTSCYMAGILPVSGDVVLTIQLENKLQREYYPKAVDGATVSGARGFTLRLLSSRALNTLDTVVTPGECSQYCHGFAKLKVLQLKHNSRSINPYGSVFDNTFWKILATLVTARAQRRWPNRWPFPLGRLFRYEQGE